MFEDHGQVIKAAKIGGVEPADVLTELKERNPNIPDHAFEMQMHSDSPWRGV